MKLKEGVLSADVDQNGHVMLMFLLLKLLFFTTFETDYL